MKILFLCHGNICRSPMAEFVMKDMLAKAKRHDVTVESAALHTDELGSDTHRGTKAVLEKNSIPFSPRKAWLINAAKASEYDYLICMDDYNVADLKRLVFDEDRHKVRKLLSFAGETGDIADPWYTGNFQITYDDVHRGCRHLMEVL